MSSRKIEDLTNPMQDKVHKFLELCEDRGLDVLIYCTLRTLEEQAKLYRQGHSYYEVQAKKRDLVNRGFDYLADIMEDVGPQPNGRKVTNACCGESWHNYAEAFDAVPLLHGKPVWSASDDPDTPENEREMWRLYGKCVRDAGLQWAGDWVSFKEYPHAQLREGSNPLREMDSKTIKKILTENGLLK